MMTSFLHSMVYLGLSNFKSHKLRHFDSQKSFGQLHYLTECFPKRLEELIARIPSELAFKCLICTLDGVHMCLIDTSQLKPIMIQATVPITMQHLYHFLFGTAAATVNQ